MTQENSVLIILTSHPCNRRCKMFELFLVEIVNSRKKTKTKMLHGLIYYEYNSYKRPPRNIVVMV